MSLAQKQQQQQQQQDSVLISFDVQYDGSLLDRAEFEYAPALMCWSSMEGRRKHTVPLKWQNAAKTRSEWTRVELVLPAIEGRTFQRAANRYLVRCDDTIGVQAKVSTPNEDGEVTFQAAGDALLPFALELASDDAKPLAEWEHALDLTFNMYFDKKGNRVKKGEVVLRQFAATLKSTGRPVDVAVHPDSTPDSFSYVAANEALFSSVVRDTMVRSITMFTQEAAEKCQGMLPASEEVKRVHAPFYHTPAGLAPGLAFLMTPGAVKLDSAVDPGRFARSQSWLRKLVGYSLEREAMREKDFIDTVDAQMRRTDNTYDDAFTRCAAVVGQALAIAPTSLPYIGDFVRTGNRDGVVDNVARRVARRSALKLAGASQGGFVEFNNKNLHSVERFSHEEQNDGGDCEDGGCFASRIGMLLAKNDWQDPLVRAAGALMRQYVVSLNLGSVRSASLGNDKNDKKMANGTIIDTPEDRALPYGAHMWCEAMPAAKFVALVQRSVVDLDPDMIWPQGASRAPWVAALPHLVVEATGRLTPLLLPATEYVVTGGEEAKRAMLERIEAERRVDHYIGANTVTLKQMKGVRQQEMLTPERDKRSTTFYRDTTHMFTTALIERGLSNIDFIWANVGKRVSAEQAWTHSKRFQLEPLSAHMRAPDAAAGPAPPAIVASANAYRQNSLLPSQALLELNAVTSIIGNKSLLEAAASAASGSSPPPSFVYGVPLEDKLQTPLLPATALVPSTPLSAREMRVIATLLRHSPPIDAPGDWEQIEEMHRARVQSLLNEGIDEAAAERFENMLFQKVVDGVRLATGNPMEREWPTKISSRWTLHTSLFSAKMFPKNDEGNKVANAIAADVKSLVDKGVVKYARVMLEEPMPHRRTVVLQMLCNASAAI